MAATFTISQLCTVNDRPPISHKVRDYLVQFITDEVLIPKKIILQDEYNIQLAMMFMPADGPGPERVDILDADVWEDMQLKAYPVVIPLALIHQAKDPYLKTIELMYEGIFLYFTAFHKSIHAHFMQDLWEKINFDYLLALPYPADIAEQQYLGD